MLDYDNDFYEALDQNREIHGFLIKGSSLRAGPKWLHKCCENELNLTKSSLHLQQGEINLMHDYDVQIDT